MLKEVEEEDKENLPTSLLKERGTHKKKRKKKKNNILNEMLFEAIVNNTRTYI